MTEEETILGIPIGKIKSRRNLIGTWRHFGGVYERPCHNRQQFDALGVPDLQVAEYILDCGDRKQRDAAIKASDNATNQAQAAQSHKDFLVEREERQRKGAEEHQVKYGEYLKDYDVPTEADRAALWALAGIDLALRKNLAAQYAYYEKVDASSIQNKKLLSDEVARLSTELRQLQKMLGIDMPTRIRAEQQATGVDVVRTIVDESAEFISNEMIEVEHCGILIAWLADFFEETGGLFEKQCPRCGEKIVIQYEEKEMGAEMGEMQGVWGGRAPA